MREDKINRNKCEKKAYMQNCMILLKETSWLNGCSLRRKLEISNTLVLITFPFQYCCVQHCSLEFKKTPSKILFSNFICCLGESKSHKTKTVIRKVFSCNHFLLITFDWYNKLSLERGNVCPVILKYRKKQVSYMSCLVFKNKQLSINNCIATVSLLYTLTAQTNFMCSDAGQSDA